MNWESEESNSLQPLKRGQGIVRRMGVERGARPAFKARVNGADIHEQPLLEKSMQPSPSTSVCGVCYVCRVCVECRDSLKKSLII